MSRTQGRISRSLIGILIVVLVLGMAFYLKNTSKSSASETPRAAEAAPTVAISGPTTVPAEASTAKPVVAIAPPATQPVPQLAEVTKDADAKKAGGDLLGARATLDNLLINGQLNPADAETVKKSISDLNQTIVFSPQKFSHDEYGGSYQVQPGEKLTKIADKYEIPYQMILRINGMSDARKLRSGQWLKVVSGPINVVVNKGKFTMDLWLGPAEAKGGMYLTSYSVGLGRDDSTPTGTWMAEAGRKIKDPTYYSPRGEGVVEASDPKNPLGHRWIGLTGIDGQAIGKMSYGIHGTIDETSIGKQASMGCIRMHNADVEVVFDMITDGKSVVIVKS